MSGNKMLAGVLQTLQGHPTYIKSQGESHMYAIRPLAKLYQNTLSLYP
jgi:hypothetical protein